MASPTVFISYSHVDREFVEKLRRLLDKAGVEYFLDAKDVAWGEKIDDRVRHALATCSAVIVVMSPASLKSQWVPFEIGHAVHDKKKVLPLLTHPSLEVPGFLANVKHLVGIEDATAYFRSDGWKSLMRELSQVNSPSPSDVAAPRQSSIVEPSSGATVGRRIEVRTAIRGLSPLQHPWLAVKVRELWWPKEPKLPAADGEYPTTVHEGGPDGLSFSLVLFAVSQEGSDCIEQWLARGHREQEYPGFDATRLRGFAQLDEVAKLRLAGAEA